jgi:hypothetical protein
MGTVLSIGLSVVLTVLASTSALLGFVVGLLGTAVALQVETLVRVEPADNIEDAVQLIHSRDDRNTIRGLLVAIASNTVEALNSREKILARESLETLIETEERLRDVAAGRFRRSAGEVSVLLEQTQRVQVSLKATTDLRDIPWWESYRGETFLAANASAISERGVCVERVFFTDGSDDFDSVIFSHRNVGIHCYKIMVADLAIGQFVNMTIFDDRLTHRDEHNPDGSPRNHLYSVNPRDVAASCRLFEQLKAAGTRVV